MKYQNYNKYLIFCDESWKKGEKTSIICAVIAKQEDANDIHIQMVKYVKSIKKNSKNEEVKNFGEIKTSFLQQDNKTVFKFAKKLIQISDNRIKCLYFVIDGGLEDLELKSQKYLEVCKYLDNIDKQAIIIDNYLENQSIHKNKINTIELKNNVKFENSRKHYLLQLADLLSGAKRIAENNSDRSKTMENIIRLIEAQNFGAETKTL